MAMSELHSVTLKRLATFIVHTLEPLEVLMYSKSLLAGDVPSSAGATLL